MHRSNSFVDRILRGGNQLDVHEIRFGGDESEAKEALEILLETQKEIVAALQRAKRNKSEANNLSKGRRLDSVPKHIAHAVLVANQHYQEILDIDGFFRLRIRLLLARFPEYNQMGKT